MNKLMMRLTIGSEAIFFICLIVSYLYFRRTGNFEQQVAKHLHIKTTAVFTVFLLCSSFTFWRAQKNHQRENNNAVKSWLAATILLGIIFLAGQGHEYYTLIKEDVLINKNEFGSSFYTLTGFHGLHVFIGLIILSTALLLNINGFLKNRSSTVLSTVGIYWHFVDVVWIFVFTTIYVLPYFL